MNLFVISSASKSQGTAADGLSKASCRSHRNASWQKPLRAQILKSMACETAQQHAPLHTYWLAGKGPATLEARGTDPGRSQRDGCVFPPFSWTKATTKRLRIDVEHHLVKDLRKCRNTEKIPSSIWIQFFWTLKCV